MGKTKVLRVNVLNSQADWIADEVAAENYDSQSAVIREALRVFIAIKKGKSPH